MTKLCNDLPNRVISAIATYKKFDFVERALLCEFCGPFLTIAFHNGNQNEWRRYIQIHDFKYKTSKHRISSWYLIPKFTLLQRRSLGNRVVCFRGVKRLRAFGSTRSRGAGDRRTVTTGGDTSVDGYDGPFTCRDYGVDGSHNGGSRWHQWESIEVVRWSHLPKSLYRSKALHG